MFCVSCVALGDTVRSYDGLTCGHKLSHDELMFCLQQLRRTRVALFIKMVPNNNAYTLLQKQTNKKSKTATANVRVPVHVRNPRLY